MFATKPDGIPIFHRFWRFGKLTRSRAGTLSLLLVAALATLAVLVFAFGGAPLAQAQDDDTTTTIIDGGGGAKGFEPANVQVVPGDGQLTVSWTVTSRPGVNDNDIRHAVRWSQTSGIWGNPGAPPDDYYDDTGQPINGIVIEPGVTSYKITGLKNRVVTGVHVRSFAGWQRDQGETQSSHWVRVRGKDTTPGADKVIFDEAGYTVTEGGTVSLGLSRYAIDDTSLSNPLTVTLDTADGTAASSDYTAFSSRSITMPANVAAAGSSVVTASDDLVEGDETLTVSISVPDGSIFGAGDPTTITIEDDDRANARIAFGDDAASASKYTATVAEAVTGGTLNVPVTVSHLPGESTTFAVEVLSGGTATEGSDFSIAAKSVSFGPTDSSKTKNVAITLTDDVDYEEDETIELRIIAADGVVDDLGDHYGRDAAGATATITISGDPRLAPKTYALTPAAVTGTEGGIAELTLTLGEDAPTGGLAFSVTPTYAAGAGKAAAADLNSPPAKVTVAENQRTATVSIPIAADGLVEGSETFTVTVTADAAGWSVDSNRGNTATITIPGKDRETAKIAFGTDAASTTQYTDTVAEGVASGTLHIPVTVSHLPGSSTTFAVEVLSGSTAAEGSDFSIAVKSVTFGPTDSSKTKNVAITLTDDSDSENDETIQLRIAAADDPANDPGDYYGRDEAGATATIAVTSDELGIAFGTDPTYTTKYTATVAEAVSGGTLNVPVTVSLLPLAPTIFAVEVLSGGTATEGSDFSIAVKSVTFGPTTARTQHLTIAITNDSDSEGDETIELRVAPADDPANDLGDRYARGAGATATIIITNSGDTTTIIDGGGEANGYEPANVQVTPGDGQLTVSWTVTSRPGVNDNDIRHAVRWSQTSGIWDNPWTPSDHYFDSFGRPIDGFALEPGVTSYNITGLKNRVVTGVHVRSFTGPFPGQGNPASSHWVRVKGASTTPVGDEVFFNQAGYSVTEGGTVSLGLSRDAATASSLNAPLTVTLDTADGTAASTDYTGFSSRSITMPANAAAATSSVGTTSDDLVEEDETLTVSMSVPETSIFRAASPSTVTITIEDDDRPNARIAFGNDAASTTKYTATVAEAVTGGTLNVPVTVSHLPGAPTTFAVEVLSGSTATEGSDFSITAKSVSFGPTDSTKTKNVAITLTDDADYENDETIELRIVAADGVVDDLGDHYVRDAAAATATVTVTSADVLSAAKTYTIPSAVSVTEGGNAELTLTLGEATAESLAFNVSATYGAGSGKAASGDVKGFRSSTHTVAAGKSSDTISIPVPTDGLVENPETFTVSVSTDDIRWSVASGGGDTATVTINDNDRATAKVAFGNSAASTTKYTATVPENKLDGYLIVPITINHKAVTPVTFNVEVLDTGTAAGYVDSANPGDYRLLAKSVTFDTHWTENLRIFLSNDRRYEEDETIELRIVAADDPVDDLGDHYARHASGATATITITSDESHFVLANQDSLTAVVSETTVYTVVLTDVPTEDVTVTPVSSNYKATVSGPVTFTSDNWSVPQEITVTGASVGDATISHQVSSDDANFSSSKTGSVNVSITAPAVVAPTKFYEITSAVTVAEGNTAELTVTLSEAAPADMTFNVTYNYRASTATAADTGSATPATITVAAGNTTATLQVPIAVDSTVEADEELKLYIGPGQGVTAEWGAKVTDAKKATITISDATIAISIGRNSFSVGEGDGSFTVPITFSSATLAEVTLRLRADSSGSATLNHDYRLPSNVTVPKGATTASFTVTILEDKIQESDETFNARVEVESPAAGYGVGAAGSAEVTISDNDTAGVTVNKPSVTVREGSTFTYTVKLRSRPSELVVITPTSDDTDKVQVSRAVYFSRNDWDRGKQITATGVKSGTVTVSHQASSSDPFYSDSLTIDSVEVTVTPLTAYGISATATASEGENAELTVTLYENAPAGGLEFTVTPTYGSGAGKAAATDLNAPPATVRVPESQRTATLSIPIGRDALVEGNETFTVTISTSASGWVKDARSVDTATVTITDLTREVSLAAAKYTVGESDGKVTVGLAVSGAHTDTITSTVTLANGSATLGTDFGDSSTATTTTVSFAPGETAATLDIAILGDALAEGSETFTVTITAVSAGHAIHASDNAAAVTIADDDSAGLVVSPTTLSVVEYGTSAYTLALGTEPTHSVTVTPTSSAEANATVGDPVTFTTSDWKTPKEITVTGVLEGNATITHTVTSDDAGYAALTPDAVAVTVTPYGKTYTITTAVTVTEGQPAHLVITLGENAPPPVGLTFDLKTTFETPAADKAEAGDLRGGIQTTANVSFGNSEVRVLIPVASDDLLGEEDETFTVSITNVHNQGVAVPEWKLKPGGSKTATVTIRDVSEATSPKARVAFGENPAATTSYIASVAENVSGGTLNVPVTVSHLPTQSTAFTIEVAGTATAYTDDANPGDYRIADKSVTFGPTDSSKTKNVVIAITDDDDVEAAETIALIIAAAANPVANLGDHYARDAAGATATITINSDEAAQGSTKTYSLVSAPSAKEGEDAQLTVTLGENAPEGGLEFSVSYDYSGSRASAGDTGATPSTVAVEAGSNSTTLSVPIAADSNEDDGETFTVTITTSAPGWAVAADGTNTATVTITDTTEAMKFSAGGYTVIEGSAANVVVMRTGPTKAEAEFELTGFGYGPTRGIPYFLRTVTIPAGASATAVSIETKDDAKVEGDGTVGLILQRPSAGYRLVGATYISLTIKDNDGAQQYPSTYTIDGAATASEGTNAELTVTLGEAAHEDGLEFIVSYDYSGSAATAADTGEAPTTLSVTAGSNSATLSVPIAGDTDDDDGETFVVSITPGAGDTDWTVAPSGSASATVTISGQAAPPLSTSPVVSTEIIDVTLVKVDGKATVALGDHFSDEDEDALTYQAVSSDISKVTVSVDGATGVLTVTGVAHGSADVTVTATDDDSNAVSDTFTVTVKAAPVVASAISDVTGLPVGSTQEISLSGVFSDADNDALTITADSSDETKATVSVAADYSKLKVAGVAEGTVTITVTAEDTDGNRVSDAFDVAVVKSADASLSALSLSSGSISPTFSAATYAYTLTVGNDVTSTTVTATASHGAATLKAGLSGSLSAITGGKASAAISLTVGANVIQVEVTAEDGTTKQTYAVTVTRNRIPTVSAALEDMTIVNESSTQEVSLSGVFADADNDNLTITAGSSAETTATVSVAGDYSMLTVTAQARGTATITVTADDGNGGTVSDTFTVQVKAAPVVASALDYVDGLVAGTTQEVSLSGVFSDADGDSLTITAESPDETIATVSIAPDYSKLTVAGVADGTVTITVTAEDTDGNRVNGAFSVAVVEIPGPVTGLTLEDTPDGLKVSWQPPDTGGAPNNYIVHARPEKGGSGSGMTKRPRAGKGSVTFSNVEAGATYSVSVRGENAAGKGERVKAVITLGTAPTEAPGPVVNLRVTATAHSITATWEAPETGGAPTRYIAHVRPEGGATGSGETKYPKSKNPEITFRGLEAGRTYKVWVRGENAVGKGERVHATITLPE